MFFLCSSVLYAQDLGSWDIHTSTRTVSDVLLDSEGDVWIISSGGIDEINGSGEKITLTTLDGLVRLDGRTGAYDPVSSKLFVGYIDGNIDVIDTENEKINNIGDIARFENFTVKGVNDILVKEDLLYVATDFGVVTFDISGEFVKESFTKLGSFDRGIRVLDIDIKNDTIYCATEFGIAFGDLNRELTIDSNWGTHNADNGFVSEQVQALGVINSKIYASTESANFVYESGVWTADVTFGTGVISEYEFEDNFLLAARSRTLYYGSDLSAINQVNVSSELAGLYFDENSGKVFFGTFSAGAGSLNIQSGSVEYLTPEGPYQNYFKGMKFDDGVLISSSTNETARNATIDRAKGYYIYNNNEWLNYNAQNNSTLESFGFQQTFTTTITKEYYYFGSWGRGVVRHSKETGEIEVFDETNSTLRGWSDDSDQFPVISGLDTDSNDNVWLTSRYADEPLYYQTPGSDDWISFEKHSATSSTDDYFGLFVDSYDQKWITLENSSSTAGTGLLVVDTGDPENPNDDEAVKLTSNENSGNLPDDKISAIIQDRNGEIWVGTGRGIARFIFPEFIVKSTSAEERRAQWLINEDTSAISRFLLRDVNVSTMAVNGANQKWVGSVNQGVWVLNPEGSRIEKRFTKDNSPLLSDNILSIAVNDNTGEVFIATDLGLVSFFDTPKAPVNKMDKLKVYPNPFVYSKHSQITIEGLSNDTFVKILGADGSVVNELTTLGGRVNWDGLDYNGNKLGTGVYFIVALENGENGKGVGKVVIIN